MRTLPARSVSTFSHFPAGEGATPAVQITVLLAIRSPAITTPSASIKSTLCPSRTSTPNFSSRCFAASERLSENGPKTRGAISTSTTLAEAGSILRKSDLSVFLTKIARAGHFHAGGTGAHENESEQIAMTAWIFLSFGQFERL